MKHRVSAQLPSTITRFAAAAILVGAVTPSGLKEPGVRTALHREQASVELPTPVPARPREPAADKPSKKSSPTDKPNADNSGPDADKFGSEGDVTSQLPANAAAPKSDVVIDYLWTVYQRTPTKRDGHGDFTWKDQSAADRLNMPARDYVIGGMDPDFREQLYQAGIAMDAAGIQWTILSGFRDDYRQTIASGFKAHAGNSFHGGSISTGGYGHGCAVDVAGVDRANNQTVWQWLDAHSMEFGLQRPMPRIDPGHVQPRGTWRELAASLRSTRAEGATVPTPVSDSTPDQASAAIPTAEEACTHARLNYGQAAASDALPDLRPSKPLLKVAAWRQRIRKKAHSSKMGSLLSRRSHEKHTKIAKTAEHPKTAERGKTAEHDKAAQHDKTAEHSKIAQRDKTAEHSKTAENSKTSEHLKTSGHPKVAGHPKTSGVAHVDHHEATKRAKRSG